MMREGRELCRRASTHYDMDRLEAFLGERTP